MNAGVREKTSSNAVGGKADLFNFRRGDIGDPVVTGKPGVQHRKVGLHDMLDAQIGSEKFTEIGARFRKDRVLEILVVFGKKLRVGNCKIDTVEVQP